MIIFGWNTSAGQYEHIGHQGNKYTVSIVRTGNDPPVIEFQYDSQTRRSAPESRKVDGTYQLYMDNIDDWTAQTWNSDELNIWADRAGQHLLFLCHFLNDSNELLNDLVNKPNIGITVDQQLNLLSSMVAFLYSRPDVRSRLNADTYPDLVQTYYSLSQINTHLINAARYKAALCMDNDDHNWFSQKNHNREAMLCDAVNRLPKPTESGITKHESWLPIMLDRARDRFLYWYNLQDAASLICPDSRPVRFLMLWIPEILASLLVTGLLAGQFDTWPDWSIQLVSYLCYSVPILGLIIIVCAFVRKNLFIISLRIMLPRLATAITVGYFVLMSNESWQGAYDQHLRLKNLLFSMPVPWKDVFAALVRILAPLAAVYLYIYYMIGKIPGIDMGWRRAGRAFSRGLSYALLIAVPISDIFGKAMLAEHTKANPNGLWTTDIGMPGLVGRVIPEMVFYLAPLALFLGFFLQLLWEDHSLTDEI